ncbi:hypothetical protein HY546_02600 [archaeon]|nr:hypothetical protein [archaeon]
MAKPIEPTPILTGEDAERFLMTSQITGFKADLKKASFLRECVRLAHQMHL